VRDRPRHDAGGRLVGLAMTAQPNSRSAYILSAIVVVVCTLVAWPLAAFLRPSNLLMIYLMGTVIIATWLGQGPSIMAALLSVTAFDFFFVSPPFHFALSDVEYLVTFGVLVAVVLIISNRSARLREHAVAVRQYERQAAAVREAARTVQIAQLQGLAAAALSIGSTLSVEDALRVLARQARDIIGAHVSIARFAAHQDWAPATHAFSVSDAYAAWGNPAEPPADIARVVAQTSRPLRVTRSQLLADPAWQESDASVARRPPVQGWLAAPLVGPAGRHLGVIQLGDKTVGEFTETDEAILVQLAQIASVAVEKAWLDQDAERRRQAAEQLNAMSHELATTPDVPSLLRAGLRHMGLVFGSQVLALLPDAGGNLTPRWWYPETAAREPADLEVSRWVYEHRRPAGLGTTTFFRTGTLHLPLVGSRETIGVLDVAPEDADVLRAPGQLLLLETFANQIALAVERATLAEQAQQAHLRMETERLRSALLSSISHDLRTPLAAITGAASSLLWRDEEFDPETRRELKESIYEEAERLARLVENLLDMTRLESGIQARKEWQPLEDVVGAALARVERRLRGRAVTIRLPHDLPLVPIDDVLIEQVLINVLDNAVKYTDPESAVEVSASAGDGAVTVEVSDRGSGLAPGDEERVFEKFYRGGGQRIRGAGLGLAICRGIIEAHGGRIWVENRPGGGAAFRFTLPIAPAAVEAPNA
jgi:K+-sensing histidine kinase KdpD